MRVGVGGIVLLFHIWVKTMRTWVWIFPPDHRLCKQPDVWWRMQGVKSLTYGYVVLLVMALGSAAQGNWWQVYPSGYSLVPPSLCALLASAVKWRQQCPLGMVVVRNHWVDKYKILGREPEFNTHYLSSLLFSYYYSMCQIIEWKENEI